MEIAQQLTAYRLHSENAIAILSKRLNMEIESIDFQIALGAALGYEPEDGACILSHNLTADQMLELVKDFSFPEVIGEIEFEESILPEGVARRLDEEEIKHGGEIWVIHKYDPDPLPSNPHAHNKATGCKMHLGNGELYTNKNKPLGKRISKKNLVAIREKIKNIPLPDLLV